MKNPRITNKEMGLLKGAVNRVFSRSELRQMCLDLAAIEHFDPKRPRVTRWVKCASCKLPTARYETDVDHVETRVPIGVDFKDMDLTEYRDRTWCDITLLQALCSVCHDAKSSVERKLRAKAKKERSKK